MTITTDNSRYIRQNRIIGDNGQELLNQTNILCIGAGGLGSLVSCFLVAAGIGKISIIDGDKIELSNLTRQIIYNENNCGQSKADILKKYLCSLNSTCHISMYNTLLDHKNADEIIAKHDIIVDCSDNFATKYLVSDSCNINEKPLVTASIDGFNGQVLVILDELCYRCIFPKAADNASSCLNGDVIGPSVGIVASYQANEVIKLITKINTSSHLTQINCLNNHAQMYSIYPDAECINNHSLDYHADKYAQSSTTKASFIEWKDMIKLHHSNNLQLILIDTQEFSQHLPSNYSSSNNLLLELKLPDNTMLIKQQDLTKIKLPYTQPLVIICNYGYKSKLAAIQLINLGYHQVYYTSLSAANHTNK